MNVVTIGVIHLNIKEFKKTLKESGYITRKKAIEYYVENVNVKKNYDSTDIIDAYRWFNEKVDWINYCEYRRDEMGSTTKRYKQSSRMGSDSVI